MSDFLTILYHLYCTSFIKTLPKGFEMNLSLMLFESQEENLYLQVSEVYGFHKDINLIGNKHLITGEEIMNFLSSILKGRTEIPSYLITDKKKLDSYNLRTVAWTIMPLYLDETDILFSAQLNIEVLGPIETEMKEIEASFKSFTSSLNKNLYPLQQKVFETKVLLSIAEKCRISFALMESYACEFMGSQWALKEYLDKMKN